MLMVHGPGVPILHNRAFGLLCCVTIFVFVLWYECLCCVSFDVSSLLQLLGCVLCCCCVVVVVLCSIVYVVLYQCLCYECLCCIVSQYLWFVLCYVTMFAVVLC